MFPPTPAKSVGPHCGAMAPPAGEALPHCLLVNSLCSGPTQNTWLRRATPNMTRRKRDEPRALAENI